MSNADLALVRIVEPGGINLAVGEPYFLHEVFNAFYPRYFEGSLTYPPLTGDPELIDMLKQNQGYEHIVITNGAKQALYAAVYALQWGREKHNQPQYRRLYHPAPFWPTYPTIAALSHLTFKAEDVADDPRRLRVITSPNNPDGAIDDSDRVWDIWDGAYANPIYGWREGMAPKHRIAVFSGAKLFGPSSYRVGWIGTNDQYLAAHAAQFVEKHTSGVPGPSQAFFKGLLRNIDSVSTEESVRMISRARTMLTQSSSVLMDLSKHFAEVQGYPDTHVGMFAWVRARDPERFKGLLSRAKVRVVGGQFCGVTDDWFRISLGVLPEVMHAAVKAIIAQE